MNINVGSYERLIRVLVGAVVIATGIIYQNYWGAIGLVPLITGLAGWCPAYRIFGFSSCRSCENVNHGKA